ncbi:2-deoxy-5-keto-D-gluconate 6-phosphate aldolase domain-containing protein [Micromonospora sp. NPDC007271]|uniref:2-deoxy-5-keto-D-gluconate 6-phosphate aldolase domain-containing protein n=1 Tax=Micromonospora sp. NPDC007271 TaxID=3154587 RepID=UPI0033EA234D
MNHRQHLLILAVDQRPWLTQALYGHTGTATVEQRAAICDGKHMVLEGLVAALAEEPRLARYAGILVDATLGAGVAERARASGVTVSMPLERGGCEIYESEPDDLKSYLDHHHPELPKVLVRYNVEGDTEGNRVQRERLAEVATAVRESGGRFLFELLVPPTPAQLDAVGGDPERFNRELRPTLVHRAMVELLDEVPVDVWKLEHLQQPEHYRTAVRIAAEAGGECILLGANAPAERVENWLADAAGAGFTGFAVGRSIWWNAFRGLLAGDVARPDAVAAVAANYRRFAAAFLAAAPEGTEPAERGVQ